MAGNNAPDKLAYYQTLTTHFTQNDGNTTKTLDHMGQCCLRTEIDQSLTDEISTITNRAQSHQHMRRKHHRPSSMTAMREPRCDDILATAVAGLNPASSKHSSSRATINLPHLKSTQLQNQIKESVSQLAIVRSRQREIEGGFDPIELIRQDNIKKAQSLHRQLTKIRISLSKDVARLNNQNDSSQDQEDPFQFSFAQRKRYQSEHRTGKIGTTPAATTNLAKYTSNQN